MVETSEQTADGINKVSVTSAPSTQATKIVYARTKRIALLGLTGQRSELREAVEDVLPSTEMCISILCECLDMMQIEMALNLKKLRGSY